MSLFFLRDCCGRIVERKRIFLLFGALFLLGVLLGICFVKSPAVYGYHLNICERFLGRVCFSDRDVFVIFIERTAGNSLLLVLLLLAGVHLAGLAVPPTVLIYRAYTFGGSIAIFCSVFRVTGVLIVFVLYLPVHLLIDVILLGATVLSCDRARHFCFCRRDFIGLAWDFLALFLLIALVCLFEMLLLFAVFHPLGTII